MSSNMIKAYSIAYDTQKIKSLDMEVRENELEERVRKIVSSKPAIPENKEVQEFVPGLLVEDLGELEISEEAPEAKPELTEQDIDVIKQSLREEIMLRYLVPEAQRKRVLIARMKSVAIDPKPGDLAMTRLNILSSPVTITRRTVLQKVRHHPLTGYDCL